MHVQLDIELSTLREIHIAANPSFFSFYMLTALEENVFLNIFLAVVIIAMYGVYDNIT